VSNTSIFGGQSLRFPSEVIDADHAQRLIDQSRNRIDPTLLSTRPRGRSALAASSAAHVERLFQAASRVTQPALPRFPGVRGALSVRLKKGLIRVLYWYVEPRWATQSSFNRECSEAVKAMSDELEMLKKDIRGSVATNRKLRQELDALRDQSGRHDDEKAVR
jgi:hypothetical protein